MIKIKDISLAYGDKVIFDKFSLTMEKGEKVLLNAASGRGKSSLLKIVMGFVEVDSGQVIIDNEELSAKSVKGIRNKIAYLPQEITFPKMKVIALIKKLLSFSSNKSIIFDQVKVEKMLKDLRLTVDILQDMTDSLSGGEKQRIAILIMQLLDREIFLLDEITSALNSELKNFIVDYFLRMNKTIIVASHDDIWHKSNLKKVEW